MPEIVYSYAWKPFGWIEQSVKKPTMKLDIDLDFIFINLGDHFGYPFVEASDAECDL